MMKPNDFCVNDVKFRCVWGEPDRFIPGRLKFGGGANWNAPFASMVVIFRGAGM